MKKSAYSIEIVGRICIWKEKFKNAFNRGEEGRRVMKLCTIISWKNMLYFLPYLFWCQLSLNKSTITGTNMASSESVYMIAASINAKLLGKEQKSWIFYPIICFSFSQWLHE